jgi:exonuclease III
VHEPSEEESDYSKDRFYKEIEQVFDNFSKYHTKIMLGDFNVKLGRGDIFKPTNGKDSLHQDSNDNGVSVVHYVTSKKSS